MSSCRKLHLNANFYNSLFATHVLRFMKIAFRCSKMYALRCSSKVLSCSDCSVTLINVLVSQLGSIEIGKFSLPIRNYSTERGDGSSFSNEVQKNSLHAVSYLMNSCGLSHNLAISVANKVDLSHTERPDLVLAFLREHGFGKCHISKLVPKFPSILQCCPEKTLLPKLEFFGSVGVSGDDLVKFFSSSRYPFAHSLEKRIIPCYDYLKSVLHDEGKVFSALKHGPAILRSDVHTYVHPNIELLRKFGVPNVTILNVITLFPFLLNQKTDRFRAGVKEVLEMRFNPFQVSFVRALAMVTSISKSTREHKKEIYKSWGLSEDEVSNLLIKFPQVTLISKEKIDSKMDFLVNKMGFQTAAIMKSAIVLCFSLEKRMIPRCKVVRFLQLKGLVRKRISLYGFLQLSEKDFFDNFVARHSEKFSQLSSIYRGEMELLELGYRLKDIHQVGQWQHELKTLFVSQETKFKFNF